MYILVCAGDRIEYFVLIYVFGITVIWSMVLNSQSLVYSSWYFVYFVVFQLYTNGYLVPQASSEEEKFISHHIASRILSRAYQLTVDT